MCHLLLLTLTAVVTFAQPPQDTLRTKVYAPKTVRQKFLEENPALVELRRTEHSIHFRKADGTRLALISQYLHWSDPQTGLVTPIEPALWTLDNGWRLEGGPVKVRIVQSGTAWTFELYHQRSDKQWKTISFTVPPPVYDQALAFSFAYQRLAWKLRLIETGFELTADVPTRQRSQNYSFPQAARLLNLTADPSTGDLTGDGFRLTHAVMVRADGVQTPCSAWQIKGANASFTCDDSEFPPEAFPYVIDPSGSFYPTASGDDGWAQVSNYAFYGCPAWPGGLAVDYVYGSSSAVNTVRSRSTYSQYCAMYSDQGYVRFDTSSIPSGATIVNASVSVNAASVQDGNQNVSGGSGCGVQADWYASGNWPLSYNEWNMWGAGDAMAPQDLTGKPVGWNTFSLQNLTHIPTGAGAYAGLKWSVPCAPFIALYNDVLNEFSFYSFDSGASTKPYLTVGYNEPMVQHVITSAPAGRPLTVDGTGCTSPCTFYWTAGTAHTIATTTPQGVSTGVQYAFSSWSDGGALSHTITASSSAATYTANFVLQYQLTTIASPSIGGTISPGSGWYNSGTVIQVSATAYPGYQFSGFSGDLSGTATPQNLTMVAPKSVVASFAVSSVQHVITTSPSGRSLTVDGGGCTSPCTFNWSPGTSHTIATSTPQAGGTGTQYVFVSWSDSGALSHSITASSSPATYTASFTTQYYLTTSANTPAGGSISPASGWRNNGEVVPVSATANSGYQFSGFSGDLSGTTTPQNLTMNAPKSVTANFGGVQHVITTSPAGLSLTVDSAGCTSPCSFYWTAGTGHTIATSTPQAGPTGTQYVFSSWSDSGALSHSVTASSSPATYTASFATQYYLTTSASPPAGGSITPASGWRNNGELVQVSATANSGYQFSGFSGDLNGTTTPQNLTMNAPESVTANFGGVQHVITTSPAGLSLTVDSAGCTSPCTFYWTAGTGHTIATTTPQAGPTGTQYLFSSWSDSGALSHSITASSSPATYTANFITQYYLTTAASPTAGGTISPPSGWRNNGEVVPVSATANSGYQFSGFSGDLSGTSTPQNLTMTGPKSVTASFGGVQHVITTSPVGRSVTVDGAGYTSPWTFYWTPGSQHTIATTSPQDDGAGTQYLFSNWSDGGAISHTVTAAASPATYTANFLTVPLAGTYATADAVTAVNRACPTGPGIVPTGWRCGDPTKGDDCTWRGSFIAYIPPTQSNNYKFQLYGCSTTFTSGPTNYLIANFTSNSMTADNEDQDSVCVNSSNQPVDQTSVGGDQASARVPCNSAFAFDFVAPKLYRLTGRHRGQGIYNNTYDTGVQFSYSNLGFVSAGTSKDFPNLMMGTHCDFRTAGDPTVSPVDGVAARYVDLPGAQGRTQTTVSIHVDVPSSAVRGLHQLAFPATDAYGNLQINQLVGIFVYDPTPVIATVTPNPIPAGSATTLTITGTGFGDHPTAYVAGTAYNLGAPARNNEGDVVTFSVTLPLSQAGSSVSVYLRSNGAGGQPFFGSPQGAQQGSATSNTLQVQVSRPTLTVLVNGQQINPDATLTINPQDPPLRISTNLTGASGSVQWQLHAEYTHPDDSNYPFDEYYPYGPLQPMAAGTPWDATLSTGGRLTVLWILNGGPTNSDFWFNVVGGANPARTDIEAYLGSEPWFIRLVPGAESAYRQFDGGGRPLWGPPHGYGLMQVDPSTTLDLLFNWRSNGDAGRGIVQAKFNGSDAWWTSQLEQWENWNLAHPDSPVPLPDDRTEANCTFSGETPVPAGKYSFRDAIWIKQYNGASGGNYIAWIESPDFTGWQINDVNSLGFNYVNRICSVVP